MKAIKQHCMLKLKKGERHPIFSVDYLPENIASLVEASILGTEYLLIVFFLLNFFIDIFSKYSMNFVPTIMVNAVANNLFKIFKLSNTQESNLIALIVTVFLYILAYRYFEYIKFNLHPRKIRIKKENLSKDKFSLVDQTLLHSVPGGQAGLEANSFAHNRQDNVSIVPKQ